MTNPLEFWGSALNFVGGALLTLETLSVKRQIHEKGGLQRLQGALGTVGSPDALTDAKGRPLSQEGALQLWFAERSFRWGWVGFLLMTSGFLLQAINGW